MDHLRWHVYRLARPERSSHQLFPCLGSEDQLAGQHVHRLVLQVVVLKAEHVSRLDVKDLSDIAVGPSPDQLVPPRLLPPVRRLRHQLTTGESSKEDGLVGQELAHAPQPTQPSRRRIGWPPSS